MTMPRAMRGRSAPVVIPLWLSARFSRHRRCCCRRARAAQEVVRLLVPTLVVWVLPLSCQCMPAGATLGRRERVESKYYKIRKEINNS